MTVDNKNQEKKQSSVNLIEKLNEAEIAVKDGDWLTPEEIETSLGNNNSILNAKLKEMRKQIRHAVECLIAEANDAANGKSDFGTYEDIFGSEAK